MTRTTKKKGRKRQKQTTRQNQDRCPLFPSYYYNMLSPPDLTWSPSNTIKKPVKSNLDAVMSSSSFCSSAILSRSYVQAFPLPNVPLLNAPQKFGSGIFFGRRGQECHLENGPHLSPIAGDVTGLFLSPLCCCFCLSGLMF